MTYFSGDKYEGGWKNGKPHTEEGETGTWTYATGQRLEGPFADGEPTVDTSDRKKQKEEWAEE